MVKRAIAVFCGVALITAAAVAGAGCGGSSSDVADDAKKSGLTIEKNGRKYSCPSSVGPKLTALTDELVRIKAQEKRVARKVKSINKKYPGSRAPEEVATRYNALVKQDKRLVKDYNKNVKEYNALLAKECD